jgi:hypothetical protein
MIGAGTATGAVVSAAGAGGDEVTGLRVVAGLTVGVSVGATVGVSVAGGVEVAVGLAAGAV